MEQIVDSVVVGKKTPDADVEVCLFVVLREGTRLDDELITAIKKRIAEGATNSTAQSRVKVVAQASCLHRNRSSCRLEACGTSDLALYF